MQSEIPIYIEVSVVMIASLFDIQLDVQSVPITTELVSSNPALARHARYNIMYSSLSVAYDSSVVFSGYTGFLHQIKRTVTR
jgi:hypothetical protein